MSGNSCSRAAISDVSPSALTPIIAIRRLPSDIGLVTATTCIVPASSSRWTSLAHRSLGQPDGRAEPGVGQPPVVLQLLDDRPIDLVERMGLRRVHVRLDHHVLELGVGLDRVRRHVLADARLLEPAVRHLGDQRSVVVDPNGAELHRVGHPVGPPDVARPDRCRQAVVDPVGPRKGLGFVGETLDGDDRSEHLALDDLGVLGDVGDDGRFVEEPGTDAGAPAGGDRSAGGDGAFDEAGDAGLLLGRDHRAELGRLVLGGAHLQRGGSFGEPGDEVVVDRRRRRAPGSRRCSPARR